MKTSAVGWASSITAISAAAVATLYWYNKVPVPESVKEFHMEAMAPMQTQMNRSEGKVTALTIPPIWRQTCEYPNNLAMRELLAERIQEYETLLGRDYNIPECPNAHE